MAISPIDQSLSPENMKGPNKKLNSSEKTSLGENSPAGNASDKVELSPEAKRLHEAQMQSRLTNVRAKVNSGYYNSEDVLNAVAGSLVKVIRGK